MNRQRKQLVDRLEASGKEYLAYLSQFSEEQVQAAPAPNEWSMHQVAAHVRDTEQNAFLLRALLITTEEHPAVRNFDQDAWWEDHPYSTREPLKKIMAEFRAARRKMVSILRRASDDDWKNWAVHSAYGRISLDWVSMHAYHHTLEHIAQIGFAHEKGVLKSLNR